MSLGDGPANIELDEFIRQALDPRVCFLCNSAVDQATKSLEHVFPKWLLHRHSLLDAHMTLLNGTPIPYRELTITCCKTCNNNYLSRLESEVQGTFERGADAVRGLSPERLFLWLAKFYYGLLFRELRSLLDRRDPGQGTIVTQEFLREYGVHHLLLRRLLGTVECAPTPVRGKPPCQCGSEG